MLVFVSTMLTVDGGANALAWLLIEERIKRESGLKTSPHAAVVHTCFTRDKARVLVGLRSKDWDWLGVHMPHRAATMDSSKESMEITDQKTMSRRQKRSFFKLFVWNFGGIENPGNLAFLNQCNSWYSMHWCRAKGYIIVLSFEAK